MDLIANLSIDVEAIVVVIENPNLYWVHPKGVAAMEQLAPVYILPMEQIDSFLIEENVDIAVAWGISQLPQIIHEFSGKIIVCCHGSDLEWSQFYVQQCVSVVDLFVGVSKSVLRPFSIVDPQRVRIIHNGIDPVRCGSTMNRQEARCKLGINSNDFVMGYVGRYSDEKRADLMIQAIGQLENCKILLVGSGHQEARLREVAVPLGDRAIFVEHTYQVGDLIAAMDCFCGLAKEEGFWFGGTEAALVGVPLVCTTVGVLEEIQQEHGLLWEEVSKEVTVDELVRAIQRMQADSSVFFRAAKLKAILSQFTMQRMARRWEELLRGCIGEVGQYVPRSAIQFVEGPNFPGIYAFSYPIYSYPPLLYYRYVGNIQVQIAGDSPAEKFATHWEYQPAHHLLIMGAAPFRFRRTARTLQIPMPPPTYEYEVPQYEPFTIGPMVITNSTGAPIDLTGKNLIFTASADFTFILTGYAIMVSGVYHNIVYVTSSSNNTQTDQMFVWMLRDASTGNTLAQGLLTVTSPIIGFYCCNPTCATIPMLLVKPKVGRLYTDTPAYEAGATQCQIANKNTT
jgi:glycosyltransferase involved in cell wall biosynthesis